MTLIAHERCYEIRISSKHKKIQLYDLCSYVLSATLYIPKSLYKQLVPQIAFQCPCPDHESSRGIDHLCILTDDGFWVQFLCGDNPVGLREHQQIWFGTVSYKSMEVLHDIVCYLYLLLHFRTKGWYKESSITSRKGVPASETNSQPSIRYYLTQFIVGCKIAVYSCGI